MKLIDPFLAMARDAGLINAAPYDPVAATFTAHAGNYALLVSAMPDGGDLGGRDARVSISWGLDQSGSTDGFSSLILIHDFERARWRLEFDLKGIDIPGEIRDLARRYDLSDPQRSLLVATDARTLEIGRAMVTFIAMETDRTARRPSGPPSRIPLTAFLASGPKLP